MRLAKPSPKRQAFLSQPCPPQVHQPLRPSGCRASMHISTLQKLIRKTTSPDFVVNRWSYWPIARLTMDHHCMTQPSLVNGPCWLRLTPPPVTTSWHLIVSDSDFTIITAILDIRVWGQRIRIHCSRWSRFKLQASSFRSNSCFYVNLSKDIITYKYKHVISMVEFSQYWIPLNVFKKFFPFTMNRRALSIKRTRKP